MIFFDHELHVHLFGCLAAEDIYRLGLQRYKTQEHLLKWYASEYEKAWGRQPYLEKYWGPDGIDWIKRDFLFVQKEPFHRFQACFNLLIALFKIHPDDSLVLEHVLHRNRQEGLKYVEYRTVLPTHFTEEEIDRYLRLQCETVLKLTDSKFVAKLAFTLMRDEGTYQQQYQQLRRWMDNHPSLAPAICAIDFAYFEENHPPFEKRTFFEKVRKDNLSTEHPLAILYHVGESFNDIPLDVSARWVFEAAQYGAHRLGHAISLGVHPKVYRGKRWSITPEQRHAHCEWLRAHRDQLAAWGYAIEEDFMDPSVTQICVNDQYVEECYNFQSALINGLKDSGTIIECCPTSNERIAQIPKLSAHPIKRFLAGGLRVVLAADDPGIFETSLANEADRAREEIGLNEAELEALARRAQVAKSSDLV